MMTTLNDHLDAIRSLSDLQSAQIATLTAERDAARKDASNHAFLVEEANQVIKRLSDELVALKAEKPSDPQKPTKPAGLKVDVSTGQAVLSWATKAGETYRVSWRSKAREEQDVSGTSPVTLKRVDQNNRIIDPLGWQGWAKVRAFVGDEGGEWSDEVEFFLPAGIPAGSEGSIDIPSGAVRVKPGDDLQKAINSLKAGGAIVFEPGTYDITKTLTTPAGVSFRGADPLPILKRAGDIEFIATGNNQQVWEGFVFDGAGMKFEAAREVTIERNVFTGIRLPHLPEKNGRRGQSANGITFGGSITDCIVRRNTFVDIYHLGVWVTTPSQFIFEDNRAINCAEIVHTYNYGKSRDVWIRYNYASAMRSHGMECQNWGDTQNFNVVYNWLENFAGEQSNMGLSIAMGDTPGKPAKGINVIGNVVIAGPGVRKKIDNGIQPHWFAGIELMGQFAATGNYLEGWTWNLLVGVNTADAKASGNTILGDKFAPIKGIGSAHGQEYVPEHLYVKFNAGDNVLGKVGDKPRPVLGKDAGPRS